MRGGRPGSRVRRAAAVAWGVGLLCYGAAAPASGSQSSSAQTSLNSISCPDHGACLGVGQTAVGGELVPLAEIVRGTRSAVLPTDAIGRSSQLSGVSCVSATFCMAVGAEPKHGPLTEIWDGVSWTREAVLSPPGTATLTAVSCVSDSFCIAVGGTPLEEPLVELWNGVSWARMSSPDSTGTVTELLSGVSCASQLSCVAVGTSFANGGESALVERYSNGVWKVLPAGPLGGSPTLTSVSCPAAQWCTAVGSVESGGMPTSLLLHVSVTAVSAIATAATPQARLYGVSCPHIDRCVVVGDVAAQASAGAAPPTATSSEAPFAQRLSGGVWQSLTPLGVGSSAALTGGVSCAPRGGCLAVGYTVSARDGTITAMAQRLVGQTWSVLKG